MGALDQLESFLQELLDRPAWLLSARRLQPAQLAAAISRELDEHAVRLADRVIAPSSYTLLLSSEDFAQIQPHRADLEIQLGEYVERLAAERDLSLPADPVVRIRVESELKPGHPVAQAHGPAMARSETPMAALRRATRDAATASSGRSSPSLTLLGPEGEGVRRFPLERSLVSIGRRSDNQIAIADLNLSRYHAELAYAAGNWFVTDLGSTNGTTVNGEPLSSRRKLSAGDVIGLGLQQLLFQP